MAVRAAPRAKERAPLAAQQLKVEAEGVHVDRKLALRPPRVEFGELLRRSVVQRALDAVRAEVADRHHRHPSRLGRAHRAQEAGRHLDVVVQEVDDAVELPVGQVLERFVALRVAKVVAARALDCLLYTSPSPRDKRQSRMPSSA